jgi:hypothetical protein
MATETEIKDMAQAADLVRANELDNMVYDENGNLLSETYWQGWMGDPVNAVIQILGADETEARTNLGDAAWAMIQNREETAAAAETPVVKPQAKAKSQTRKAVDENRK